MKFFTKINVLLVVSIFFIVFLFTFNKENAVIENKKNENVVNTNTLTMMYETESNSGEYQVASDNVWPGDEYIFNETLSKCENGSKLSWNNENKKVLLQANTSDKCYVYFDKYIMPQITNVDATNVTSDSITVSVTATAGDSEIISYYYSINDGEYVSSENSSYTFNNLEAETSYIIKVYVTDKNEVNSIVKTINVTTKISPKYILVETSGSLFPIVTLNSYNLQNGDSVIFNKGDTLYITPSAIVGGVSIYNKNNELIANLEIVSCDSFEYILTGDETKIILNGRISGAYPEKCA